MDFTYHTKKWCQTWPNSTLSNVLKMQQDRAWSDMKGDVQWYCRFIATFEKMMLPAIVTNQIWPAVT